MSSFYLLYFTSTLLRPNNTDRRRASPKQQGPSLTLPHGCSCPGGMAEDPAQQLSTGRRLQSSELGRGHGEGQGWAAERQGGGHTCLHPPAMMCRGSNKKNTGMKAQIAETPSAFPHQTAGILPHVSIRARISRQMREPLQQCWAVRLSLSVLQSRKEQRGRTAVLQRLEQHTVCSSPRVPGTLAHTDTNSSSLLPRKAPTASSLQGSQRHQGTKAKATVCTSEILGFHQNLVQRASLADPRRHKGTSPCHVGKLVRCSDRSANPALVLTPNAMRSLVRMQKRVHGMRTMPGSCCCRHLSHVHGSQCP